MELRRSKYLIVNADDFGLASSINTGILEAHLKGIVTSASLLANGEGVTEAVVLAKKHPTLEVGIHLTLVGGQPLSPCQEIPSLVQGKNFFPHWRSFLGHYLLGRIRLEEIYWEWKRQIEFAKACSLNPFHIDSHQHLHGLPKIGRIVQVLAKEFKIPFIRSLRCLSTHFSPKTFVLSQLWSEDGEVTTLIGAEYSGRLSEKNLIQILQNIYRPGVYELICHPGHENSPLNERVGWNYQWQEELIALKMESVKERLAALGIILCNRREFTRSF